MSSPKKGPTLEESNLTVSEQPKPNYTASAIGISRDPKTARYHLIEVKYDPETLQTGLVTSVYDDMLEADVREKFEIEASRRDFQWRY